MIQKLHHKKNLVDVYNFLSDCPDQYEDFYITKEKDRLFPKNNWTLIEKLLKNQQIYALINKEIDGILLIYRTKGFRPYLKILAKNSKTEWNLLKFFIWNFCEEIYAKLKINNPLTKILQKENHYTKKLIFGFISKGNRGRELLLYRPKQQKIIKGEEKDADDNQ